jgi:DSF synthase
MTYLSPTPPNPGAPARSSADPRSDLLSARFDTLDVRFEADSGTFWAWMKPGPKPCFTIELLSDILAQQALLRDALSPARRAGAAPVARWYVMGSRIPGIFNLGGDLSLFAEKIRARDLGALRAYGRLCIEAVHGNAAGFQPPPVSIAMVQGDALGGGFECALACDIIIAERSAKFGLPEILFNLFPGMGAYSYLSRRIGAIETERMMTSGRIYSAEEMHAIGLVDLVAEDGQGESAVRGWIDRNDRRHIGLQGIYQARRRANPVSMAELVDIVDIWSDAAMALSDLDLRKMLRLAGAQEKRLARQHGGAIAAEAAE